MPCCTLIRPTTTASGCSISAGMSSSTGGGAPSPMYTQTSPSPLLHRVGPHAHLAADRRVRPIRERRLEHARLQVEGPAVVAADQVPAKSCGARPRAGCRGAGTGRQRVHAALSRSSIICSPQQAHGARLAAMARPGDRVPVLRSPSAAASSRAPHVQVALRQRGRFLDCPIVNSLALTRWGVRRAGSRGGCTRLGTMHLLAKVSSPHGTVKEICMSAGARPGADLAGSGLGGSRGRPRRDPAGRQMAGGRAPTALGVGDRACGGRWRGCATA